MTFVLGMIAGSVLTLYFYEPIVSRWEEWKDR